MNNQDGWEGAVTLERPDSIPYLDEYVFILQFLSINSMAVNIPSLSDTPDRKMSDTLTVKILHPFR